MVKKAARLDTSVVSTATAERHSDPAPQPSAPRKMAVVYGITTSPKEKYMERMAAIEETWAKDVPPQTLLVVGVSGNTSGITYNPTPECGDNHESGQVCKEATLITRGYELGADWVVVANDDLYIFPERMEELLAKYDYMEPQILGIHGCGVDQYCEDKKGGLCGGAGYAMSRGALKKMVGEKEGTSRTFVQECSLTAANVTGGWSDQTTSCVARRDHVKEVQLEGLYGWRLGPATPETYQDRIASSNPKALTFHYISPEEVRMIHKLGKDIKVVNLSQQGHAVTYQEKKAAYVEIVTYEQQRAAYVQTIDRERRAASTSLPGLTQQSA